METLDLTLELSLAEDGRAGASILCRRDSHTNIRSKLTAKMSVLVACHHERPFLF